MPLSAQSTNKDALSQEILRVASLSPSGNHRHRRRRCSRRACPSCKDCTFRAGRNNPSCPLPVTQQRCDYRLDHHHYNDSDQPSPAARPVVLLPLCIPKRFRRIILAHPSPLVPRLAVNIRLSPPPPRPRLFLLSPAFFPLPRPLLIPSPVPPPKRPRPLTPPLLPRHRSLPPKIQQVSLHPSTQSRPT